MRVRGPVQYQAVQAKDKVGSRPLISAAYYYFLYLEMKLFLTLAAGLYASRGFLAKCRSGLAELEVLNNYFDIGADAKALSHVAVFHVGLNGAGDDIDHPAHLLEVTVRTGCSRPKWNQPTRNWLGRRSN